MSYETDISWSPHGCVRHFRGGHCDLPLYQDMVHFAGLSRKETRLCPVYTTVKIEPSLRETKKVLTFLEVLQHFSERHHNDLGLRRASCCDILHNMVMRKEIVQEKRLC